MRNLIIVLFLFISAFASSQSRVGLVHPRVLGQATDTTQFGVILLDTVTNSGQWFTLNETDFLVEGGVLGLRFQTDSVFVQGDSLCAITNGDTLCVFQDSAYITNDSFCIIQLGDTTCVEFMGGLGTTIYTGNDTISSERSVYIPASMQMKFIRVTSPDVVLLTLEKESAPNNVTVRNYSNTANKPVLSLANDNLNKNAFIEFENSGDIGYGIGVERNTWDDFVIFEANDIQTEANHYMRFSGNGDSTIVGRDIQFDAGVLDASGDIGSSGQVLTSTGTGTNWETLAASGIPISSLLAATASNTKNHDGWEQEWQWDGLLGGTGLKLTSTNTGAIGSTQKLFSVATTGVNATPGQTTYAAHFSNSHTGSSHLNYGVYSTITGANSNSSAIYGTSSSIGTAVSGVATSGYGIYGTSSGNTAIYGVATGSPLDDYAIQAEKTTNNTSTLQYPLGIYTYSSGTPAAGFGGGIAFYNEPATGSTAQLANAIESEWTDATLLSRTSRATITGVNSASTIDLLTLNASGRSEFNTTVKFKAYTVGTLPTGTIGDMAYVTDASAPTYLATVSGGGAVVCPVFYNGTNWVAH